MAEVLKLFSVSIYNAFVFGRSGFKSWCKIRFDCCWYFNSYYYVFSEGNVSFAVANVCCLAPVA